MHSINKNSRNNRALVVILVLIVSVFLMFSCSEDSKTSADDMVFAEGGTFLMGSKRYGDTHEVAVDDFYINKYEVTQAEWKKVMGDNPSYFKGDDRPVEKVSWYDAVEFCNKKSEMVGLEKCYSGSGDNIQCDFSANGYRLPTEAEWEYAARGGKKARDTEFAGSNNIDEVAWYNGNSSFKTHSVGQKQENELGIYDMSGNVWELCNDSVNRSGTGNGHFRVLRGGSFGNAFLAATTSGLLSLLTHPGKSNDAGQVGFRFVRSR